TLYAIRVVLHEAETRALLEALDKRMSDAGAFFENEPVVVDASRIDERIDWEALVGALRKHNLHPVGVIAEGAQLQAAAEAGLPAVDVGSAPVRPAATPVPEEDVPPAAVIPEKSAEQPAAAQSAPETSPTAAPVEPPAPPNVPTPAPAAMVINRPLRSGQRVYARNTDLIVVGVVSRGAEVIADG